MQATETPPATTITLAQAFISAMMALLMTGIFTALPLGFAPGWLGIWMTRFATAWPIAFALSMGVGPLAFWLARRTQRLTDMVRR